MLPVLTLCQKLPVELFQRNIYTPYVIYCDKISRIMSSKRLTVRGYAGTSARWFVFHAQWNER
jgi:hypothetical protein